MGFKTDTIAAISTAMTNSGIGIVRLSGEDAFSIIDKIYKGKSPKLLSEQKSHTIHYGYIMDGEQTIDEVLVLLCVGRTATPVKILWKSTVTAVYLSQERYLKP